MDTNYEAHSNINTPMEPDRRFAAEQSTASKSLTTIPVLLPTRRQQDPHEVLAQNLQHGEQIH
jgi:hypothetical protein